MRAGSLFSGYGGIDLAIEEVFDAETVWHVENDEAASLVLKHRWPDVPNHGDITAVDWSAVEPVDILCGGFPCQDVSAAGKRAGLIRYGASRNRSGLWVEFARAIDQLRPSLVVIENVRNLLSVRADSDVEPCPWCLGDALDEPALRALGAVLADLADTTEVGFDAEWVGVRASDVGAPHERFRVFLLAWPAANADGDGRQDPSGSPEGVVLEAGRRAGRGGGAPAADTSSDGRGRHDGCPGGTPACGVGERDAGGDDRLPPAHWGQWAPAIQYAEAVFGRPAPAAVELSPAYVKMLRRRLARQDPRPSGMRGSLKPRRRLAAVFPEWMMGLPAGWVTAVPGLSRNDQLRILGNGVVPQQAAYALRLLLARNEAAA